MLIDAKKFSKALAMVKKVASAGFGPQCGKIRLRGDRLEAASFGVSISLSLETEADFDCVLPVDTLVGVVKGLKGELSLAQEKGSILLECGKHRSNIATEKLSDWRMVPAGDGEEAVPENLDKALACCLSVIAKSEIRSHFNGVSLHENGTQLVASDGFRVVRYTLETGLPVNDVILPKAFVEVVSKLDSISSLSYTPESLSVLSRSETTSAPTIVGCTFVDAVFPKEWLQFFPTEDRGQWVTLNMAGGMTDCLKRMTLYETADLYFPGVDFKLEGGALFCNYKGKRTIAEEEIAIDPPYTGLPWEWSTYPSYLLSALMLSQGRFTIRRSPDLVCAKSETDPVEVLVSVTANG